MNNEGCCELGAEVGRKRRIVRETDNFFVMPTIGAIKIEGYVLLCSKEHYEGMGDLPEKYHSELEETLKTTRRVLREVYNSDILVFEHGPRVGCYRGGGCLDHAHLHIVPVSINLIEKMALNFLKALSINDYYRLERISAFERLKALYDSQKASYLFVETNDLKRYMTEVNFIIPSQYLRKIIAFSIGRPDEWNWKEKPDYETLNKTIEKLQGKF